MSDKLSKEFLDSFNWILERQNNMMFGTVSESADLSEAKKEDDNVDTDKDMEGELDKVDSKQAKGDFEDREDKDIDNDGDSDGTDKYLHARRRAISKAVAKEEFEQIDEISKKTLGSYVKRAKDDLMTRSDHLRKTAHMSSNDPIRKKTANKFVKRHQGIEKAVDKMVKDSK